jgi:hypothetical protein
MDSVDFIRLPLTGKKIAAVEILGRWWRRARTTIAGAKVLQLKMLQLPTAIRV